jgi:RNA polymerase sigma-70 factor, ECF subfamily
MTTRSRRGDGRPDPGLSAIMGERRQLINLAYRLLGSLAEAEDAVQETYARWYAMTRQQQQAIENPGAWLTTVASRICLNLLGSARVRRERYVGEWIPEPLPERTEWITGRPSGTTTDPADRVTLDESVTMAFLVVLESMTPAERVALILHDVFRYPFAEVAGIVGRTPAACRQLASSARRRVRASQAPAGPAAQQAGIVKAFKQAWEAKDIDALIGLLDPDATATADGGGLATTFLRPIEGGEQIARLGRNRQPDAQQHDVPGTRGQRPARAGGSARRRHRDGIRVRRRRWPDQAHLGSAQPRETPALDEWLTRVWHPIGLLRTAATQSCPGAECEGSAGTAGDDVPMTCALDAG